MMGLSCSVAVPMYITVLLSCCPHVHKAVTNLSIHYTIDPMFSLAYNFAKQEFASPAEFDSQSVTKKLY